MKVLSLFSGIGGIDLGLQRAGMTICGQVEIDPWCRQVLAKHWPEVPRHDDVRTCAGWWLNLVADAERTRLEGAEDQVAGEGTAGGRRLPSDASSAPGAASLVADADSEPRGRGAGSVERRRASLVEAEQGVAESRGDGRGSRPDAASAAAGRPAVDLVCGGFPCQPVSQAGKRLAQADSRWLWPAFHSVIRDLRPRYVLVENVPGLLGRGMGDVLGDLAAIGYDAEWDCVPACFVGAPHIRDRVWIVAYPQRHGSGGSESGGIPASPRASEGRAEQRERVRPDARPGGGAVADAEGQRSELRAPARQRPGRPASSRTVFPDPDREPVGRAAVAWGERGQWPAEPPVGRVANGIPRRVDRLRGLGNAVVPQVAERIGRLIMAAAA